MENEKLAQYLTELRTEIAKVEKEDSQKALRLRELADKIEESVKESKNPEVELDETLRGNIEHFEAQHPSVTAVLNRITSLLSGMGI